MQLDPRFDSQVRRVAGAEAAAVVDAGATVLDVRTPDEFTSLGLKFPPSRANFILVDVGRNALDVYRRLLREGVIVRPMLSFGMESTLRVTIGTPEENRRLMKALRKVLQEAKRA